MDGSTLPGALNCYWQRCTNHFSFYEYRLHSGRTLGSVKQTFTEAENDNYKKYFVLMFGNFLKKCYSEFGVSLIATLSGEPDLVVPAVEMCCGRVLPLDTPTLDSIGFATEENGISMYPVDGLLYNASRTLEPILPSMSKQTTATREKSGANSEQEEVPTIILVQQASDQGPAPPPPSHRQPSDPKVLTSLRPDQSERESPFTGQGGMPVALSGVDPSARSTQLVQPPLPPECQGRLPIVPSQPGSPRISLPRSPIPSPPWMPIPSLPRMPIPLPPQLPIPSSPRSLESQHSPHIQAPKGSGSSVTNAERDKGKEASSASTEDGGPTISSVEAKKRKGTEELEKSKQLHKRGQVTQSAKGIQKGTEMSSVHSVKRKSADTGT